MAGEIKPCPFCGGKAEFFEERIYTVPLRNVFWMGVKCQGCGGAYIDTEKDHCYNDTIKAWNTRAFLG